MPYKNTHHKTRRQRQQRRAQQVKRVEFVLDAESARDGAIYDFLITLPPGTVGEFIRAAIHEKITSSQSPSATHASEQFNTILAELVALREVVSQPVQAETNTRRSRPQRQLPASRYSRWLAVCASTHRLQRAGYERAAATTPEPSTSTTTHTARSRAALRPGSQRPAAGGIHQGVWQKQATRSAPSTVAPCRLRGDTNDIPDVTVSRFTAPAIPGYNSGCGRSATPRKSPERLN